MTAGYVELHAKSFYSFGLGASHAHELLAQAREHGCEALALTDTNLCGGLEFARLANSLGIRPITGGELTLTGGSRVVLLAATREGYANLSHLFTLANAADRREPRLDPALIVHHAGGLILLTGGRDGPLSRLTQDGRRVAAQRLLREWRESFGTDGVYVELQRNFLQGDAARNRDLLALACDAGVDVVATNDVHYHAPERYRLQHVLAAARLNLTLDQALPHIRPNHHLHLKPPESMARLFSHVPEAVANTVAIAGRCEFNLATDLGYRLPQPDVPSGYTPQSFLERLCREAAVRRYGGVSSVVEARLTEEFRLIERHGLAGFLLLYREVSPAGAADHGGAWPGPPGDAPGGAASGSGSGIVGGAAGGLSHRHQPRGPPAMEPDPGAVHLRGHARPAGHRPGTSPEVSATSSSGECIASSGLSSPS